MVGACLVFLRGHLQAWDYQETVVVSLCELRGCSLAQVGALTLGTHTQDEASSGAEQASGRALTSCGQKEKQSMQSQNFCSGGHQGGTKRCLKAAQPVHVWMSFLGAGVGLGNHTLGGLNVTLCGGHPLGGTTHQGGESLGGACDWVASPCGLTSLLVVKMGTNEETRDTWVRAIVICCSCKSLSWLGQKFVGFCFQKVVYERQWNSFQNPNFLVGDRSTCSGTSGHRRRTQGNVPSDGVQFNELRTWSGSGSCSRS